MVRARTSTSVRCDSGYDTTSGPLASRAGRLPAMSRSRLDDLLIELRGLPAAERHSLLRMFYELLQRFYELGEVNQPPTVEPPEWLQRAVVDGIRNVSQHWPQSALFGAVRMLERFGLAKVEH